MTVVHRLVISLVLIFTLAVPLPVQAGFMDFSIKDEAELGRKFNALIRSRFPLIEDPLITDYVRDMLQDILGTMPPQPFPVTVSVLLDNSINAFAAPAGYVFLNSGLILQMEHSSEIAAVLAHELAHVSQRHIARNIERSKMLSIGTLVGVLAGAMLSGSSEAGEALAMGSLAGGQAAALKYSRDDEREADHIGLSYLVDSGYPAEGMAHAFEHIQRQMLMSGTSAPPAYMLTHPGLQERIGTVQDLAGRLSDQPSSLDYDDQQLKRVQTLIRARYTEASSAIRYYDHAAEELSCLDLLGRAIVLERLNRISEAESSLKQAEDCMGGDPLWLREAGIFAFKHGRFDQALASLEKSLNKNPDDIMARYYRSRTQAALGDFQAAADGLQQVVDELPEDREVHTTLGRIFGRSGDEFHGYLHYAYGALYANQVKRIELYLDKAESAARTGQHERALKAFRKEYEDRRQYWD